MAFPPRFLDELRARLPLSEIVARRVRLTRKGREHLGLCPFHSEKTPSFTLNDDKGFYHCFGCGAHGDVISFVRQTEGLSFPEAVERLAGEAGVPVPQVAPAERERARRETSLLDVLEQACTWFQGQLSDPEGRAARDYLAQRGLDAATIARFRLGFAPDQRGGMRRALEALGSKPEQIVEAGLAKRGDRDADIRDYFFDRIIFPITDRRGRVIAFGGRGLGDRQPKYLNSPETALFHKGRVLYGLAQAREAAHRGGEIIVTEGYTDVIALAQAGFENAVAPLGTALTEDQLQLLWRLAPEPILCFDGDNAGQRAAARAAERAVPLLRPGRSLRFATLPAGEDPDSLITSQGPSAMREVLAAARPLVEVIWGLEVSAGNLDTPERRADLSRRLRERVQSIGDTEVKREYEGEFKARQWRLYADARKPRRNHPAGRKRALETAGLLAPRVGTAALPLQREYELLALLINHPGLLEQHAEALYRLNLSADSLDRMLTEILNLAALQQDLDSRAIHRHLMEHGFELQLKKVASPRLYRQASFAAPEAPRDEAGSALTAMLAAYERRQLMAERTLAERELADDMTDARYDRLRSLVSEQADRGAE